MQPQIKQTNQYSLESFELHYYADATAPKSNYELYTDDGETYDCFGKGKYETFKAEANNKDRTINLKISKGHGRNMTQIKDNTITMVIHNLDKKPKKIIVNEEKIKSSDFIYSETSNIVSFKTVVRKTDKLITIEY
jgi:hypothetical protein